MLSKLSHLTLSLLIIFGTIFLNPLKVESASYEEQVVVLINFERQKQNLQAFSFSEKLSQASLSHNNTMVTCSKTYGASTCLTHQVNQLSEPPFFERIKATGYNPKSASENIAWGHTNPALVVGAWIKSSGHRANILGNFKDVGCDFVDSQNGSYKGMYWTCDFGVSFSIGSITPAPTKNATLPSPSPTIRLFATPAFSNSSPTPTQSVSSSAKPWWCIYAPTYYLCK